MTVFLFWFIRVLIVLLIVRLISRAITGVRPAARSRRPQPTSKIERAGGTLVRDPQCGTYLPMSRAVRVGSGSSAQYFCSETCREAYRKAHTSQSSVA